MLALRSIFDRDKFRKAESVQDGEETRIYLNFTQNFKIFVSAICSFKHWTTRGTLPALVLRRPVVSWHISLTTSAVKILR